jgi:hypothetical protein
VNEAGVEVVGEAPTVGWLAVRLMVLPVKVLPAALPSSLELATDVGVDAGTTPVVVYVRVHGQFVIVKVVGYGS